MKKPLVMKGCQLRLLLVAVALSSLGVAKAQFATPQSFAAQSNGNFSGSVLIRLPQATGGLVPSLSLGYSSHAGIGIAGVGWSLNGLSVITRCPQTIAQDGKRVSVTFSTSDRFCLDGQRLVATSGSYGAVGTTYHTEIESFSQITSSGTTGTGPAYFILQTKSGLTMTYGSGGNSAVLAQGKSSVRVWALSKVVDMAGNFYTITYLNDSANGAYYPSQIAFSGNGSVVPQNAVSFQYESRPDAVSTWTDGSTVKLASRLSQIRVTTTGSQLVRSYSLKYDNGGHGGSSRLTSVQECSNTAGLCLPPISIAWSGGAVTEGFGAPVTYSNPSLATACGTSATSGAYFQYDQDGDGFADGVCYQGKMQTIIASTGSGTFWISAPWSAPSDPCFSYDASAIPKQPVPTANLQGDFNGDGKIDLLCIQSGFVSTALTQGSAATGNLSFSLTPRWPTGGGFCTGQPGIAGVTADSYTVVNGDFDGDGRQDLLCIESLASGQFGYQVALSSGSGTFALKAGWTNPLNCAPVGDTNGDGMSDLACIDRTVSPNAVTVLFSNGDGTFFAAPSWKMTPSSCVGGYQFGDFNGDGLTDIFCVSNAGQIAVEFARGDGTFTAGISWPSSADYCMFPTTSGAKQQGRVEVLDLNGDGRADLRCDAFGASAGDLNVSFSNGDGTFTTPSALIPSGSWPCQMGSNASGPFNAGGLIPADILGTGSPSLVCWPGVNSSSFAYLPALSLPDLVAGISNGIGSITSAVYKPISSTSIYSKGTGASFPILDVGGSSYVVSSVSSDNGIGGVNTTNFRYEQLRLDTSGRGSLGFAKVTATDSASGISTQSSYSQTFPTLGLPIAFTRSVPNGQANAGTLQVINYAYSCTDFVSASGCSVKPGARYFPVYTKTINTSSWDLTGTALPTKQSIFYSDLFGNIVQQIDTTSDGYTTTVVNTYNNDTSHWWIGQLLKSQLTKSTP